MDHKNNLANLLNLANSGKKYPALSVVKSDPEVAALISKLVRSREAPVIKPQNSQSFYNLDQNQLTSISDNTTNRINDSETTMQLFPDLELAAQILISSILSPKDMVNSDIIYRLNSGNLPAELSMKLIDIVTTHIESHYKIKADLSTILREMLFISGSYINAVIPESSVDDLINSRKAIGIESISDLISADNKSVSLGILGNSSLTAKTQLAQNIATEAFNIKPLAYQQYDSSLTVATKDGPRVTALEDLIEVTDNYNLLKLPKLIEVTNRNKIHNIIKRRVSSEGNTKLTSTEFSSLVYKGAKNEAKPFVSIKTRNATARKSIGRPLIMKLPSEAVIPVHVPGDSKNHIGYFVLVDIEGNPVTRSSNANYVNDLVARPTEASQSVTSMLLAKAKNNLISSDTKNMTLDQAAKIYSDIVESDLIERLKNGVYGSRVQICKNEEVYRIMMARTFANQYTRLIYIPQELTTYFAFKYYDNGTGKSLLDDLKILTSLRAILLFAKVMAMTKNSIALTHVNMTIDPNDPDPQKTIEMSIHEIMKMRQQYFPLGINSPPDLLNWIQRAGFEFSFEGHPGIPQTKFDFETKNIQHTLPDNDLDELLRKQTFMAIGLSPETVDNGFNAEFATTVVSNNILLSKRVMGLQELFSIKLTDYVQKLITNDYVIREELLEAIAAGKDSLYKYLTDEEKDAMTQDENGFYEELMETFITNVVIDLPRPDVTTIETQSSAYNQYAESLDKSIEAWINSEIFDSSIAGNISGNIDAIKATVKAYFLRKWMAENGYMTELGDIVSSDEDGRPVVDLYKLTKEHTEGVMRSAIQYIGSLKDDKIAADNDLETIGSVATPSDDTPTDDTTSTDDVNVNSDESSGDGTDDINTDPLDDSLGGDIPEAGKDEVI